MSNDRVAEVTRVFIERLRQNHPSVNVNVTDQKWSTEDVTLHVVMPPAMTDEDEDALLDVSADLAIHLYDTTGVYVLAVAHRSGEP